MRSITIVIADDHLTVREGLRSLLSAETGMRVVGVAVDGQSVIELVEREKPRVAIVDISMPGVNGIQAAREIKNLVPDCRVLMQSMHDSDIYVREAMRAGASGYLLKDSTKQELVDAVRAVAEGRTYVSSRLCDRLFRDPAVPSTGLHGLLTSRELEAFDLSAHGYSNKEISERMEISIRTVETHRRAIMSKLGIKNQAELIRYAREHGMI